MGAMADLVPRPIFRTVYGSGDVSAEIESFVTSITYVDNLSGQADSLDIALEDRDSLFAGSFWPQRGDDISLMIGYDVGELAGMWPCGDFVIDEIEASGPPDIVTVKGLSTSVKTPTLRTVKSRGFENVKLKEILAKVGAELNYSVGGRVPDIRFERVTQYQETDLAFLRRIGEAHGCIVKVRGTEIIVDPIQALMGAESQTEIWREDAIRYRFRSKTADSTKDRVTRYWNPALKGQIRGLTEKPVPVISNGLRVPGQKIATPASWLGGDRIGRFDVEKILDRVENQAQADARIAGRLAHATLGQVEGTLEIPGDPRLRAGMVVTLSGFAGAVDGPYLVKRASHKLTRSAGYVTELDLGSATANGATKKTNTKKRTKTSTRKP
jgi:phage protein D